MPTQSLCRISLRFLLYLCGARDGVHHFTCASLLRESLLMPDRNLFRVSPFSALHLRQREGVGMSCKSNACTPSVSIALPTLQAYYATLVVPRRKRMASTVHLVRVVLRTPNEK